MHPAAMLLWLLTEPRFFFHCENLFITNLNTTQCRHCDCIFIHYPPSNPQLRCVAADNSWQPSSLPCLGLTSTMLMCIEVTW